MKTSKLYLSGLAAVVIFTFSQQTFAQDFYSSPGYTRLIDNLITNYIWDSSMKRYTGNSTNKNARGSGVSKSTSSSQSQPYVVPAYRRYPAVQFKSTGTRLTLQEYLDSVNNSPQEKAELKELVLKIFKEYEAAAATKGLQNDWALAYVSFVGLNKLVYYGVMEKPIIPFEQNVGVRDVVAEYATDHGTFNNVTDRKKQELYEFLVMFGGLTYHMCEKARREANWEELKNCKVAAAQNLRLVGITP